MMRNAVLSITKTGHSFVPIYYGLMFSWIAIRLYRTGAFLSDQELEAGSEMPRGGGGGS